MSKYIYAVDYTEVKIVGAGKNPDGSEYFEDKYETWEEAKYALISYYENAIQDASISLKVAKKLKE